MSGIPNDIGAENWVCAACGGPLRLMPVDITYMGSSFPVELAGCPACGTMFVPPELAMGRMLEVEKILEDK